MIQGHVSSVLTVLINLWKCNMPPFDNDSLFVPTVEVPSFEKRKVNKTDAEAAVRTLLEWAGDHPTREGLADTPARVARAYEEFFSGYDADPRALLSRTFEEVEGYNDIVLLRDIAHGLTCPY